MEDSKWSQETLIAGIHGVLDDRLIRAVKVHVQSMLPTQILQPKKYIFSIQNIKKGF
jgi:hypothetical protein